MAELADEAHAKLEHHLVGERDEVDRLAVAAERVAHLLRLARDRLGGHVVACRRGVRVGPGRVAAEALGPRGEDGLRATLACPVVAAAISAAATAAANVLAATTAVLAATAASAQTAPAVTATAKSAATAAGAVLVDNAARVTVMI